MEMMEMMVDPEYRPELIHSTVFVAPDVVILGAVTVGECSSVWYGAVLRGDLAPIVIGRETNVQDGCIIHVEETHPCRVGDRVTLGHGAILHGCTVEDDVLTGIRATVLDGAVIGSGSIVGAGAVVTEGAVIPPGSLALGIPARVVGSVSEEQRERIRHAAEHYVEAARVHRTTGR